MSLPNELFCQPRNNSFCTSIESGWNTLVQWRYLCNSHQCLWNKCFENDFRENATTSPRSHICLLLSVWNLFTLSDSAAKTHINQTKESNRGPQSGFPCTKN